MRRVKIVATIGPASCSPKQLASLLRAGMDVARLNFSHGTHEQHAQIVSSVRQQATALGRPVAVLQDLAGPKIRIGRLAGGRAVYLSSGSEVVLTTNGVEGNDALLPTTYQHLPSDVRPGNDILLADGSILLRVVSKTPTEVRAKVVQGGAVGEHQGINLPGVAISAPALTQKDRDDLAFGLDLAVDYVALSFVRRPEDVLEAKRLIAAAGRSTPVIAKLEKREAIDRLDEIIGASDGVMVARGDLGVELALEDVPVLQKLIVRKANERGVVVITATQMLESMVHNARPTRAEVSDVANAILDGTDAVMLSGETAVGQYPVEAVAMMDRIARATTVLPHQGYVHTASRASAIASAATALAQDLGASAIVVFTHTGHTAHLVSQQRPTLPVIALTDSESVWRHLALWWGITPVLTKFCRHTDEMIAHAQRLLVRRGHVAEGDQIVVVSYPLSHEEHPNIAVIRVGEGPRRPATAGVDDVLAQEQQ